MKRYRLPQNISFYAAAAAAVVLGILIGIAASFLWESWQTGRAVICISTEIPGVVMRFIVHGRSDTTISARIWFLDRDGKEIGGLERSWNGWEFFIDFVTVKRNGISVLYPYRIYTDTINRKYGTVLFPYYERDSMPQIYNFFLLTDRRRKGFETVFHYAKTSLALPVRPASVTITTKILRNPRMGSIYTVYTDAYGTIEITAE